MPSTALRRQLARAAVAFLALLAVAWQSDGHAQGEDPSPLSATRVKAAFLYKFAGYVEWPLKRTPGPGAPLVIGVIDADSMLHELTTITAGRTVNDHPIQVRRVAHDDLLDGIQILFIGDTKDNELGALLGPASRQPILTVTESRDAIKKGSIINFTEDRDRIRFEVSLAAAEQSQVKLSSRLLAVASRVHRTAE